MGDTSDINRGGDHVSHARDGHGDGKIVELNPRKIYSLEEVDDILPLVRRITDEYAAKVQGLMNRFEAAKSRHDERLVDIEKEINVCVQSWQAKLEKLGIKTKGLWIADFDSGTGYFCWKYPEEKVRHWHQYSDGFGGRVRIDRDDDARVDQGPPPDSLKEKTPPAAP